MGKTWGQQEKITSVFKQLNARPINLWRDGTKKKKRTTFLSALSVCLQHLVVWCDKLELKHACTLRAEDGQLRAFCILRRLRSLNIKCFMNFLLLCSFYLHSGSERRGCCLSSCLQIFLGVSPWIPKRLNDFALHLPFNILFSMMRWGVRLSSAEIFAHC